MSFFKDLLNINHQSISGVMDIIVVKQLDNTYKSTPFYIRFGVNQYKAYTENLKKDRMRIRLMINNKKTSIKMHMNIDGKGYFLINKEKSDIPNSNLLLKMNLNEGKNNIKFILDENNSIESNIFVWDYFSKIVVSDVDGTITKSDVIGHISGLFGLNWIHNDICQLYNSIYNNDYKIIYLTARPDCQYLFTKDYLTHQSQNKIYFPEGPILMNNQELSKAIKTEIIDKQPHLFKIDCLYKVMSIFSETSMYSGFGNRITDAISYRCIGVDIERIYIINELGEIVQLNKRNRLSYKSIFYNIQSYFPKYDQVEGKT